MGGGGDSSQSSLRDISSPSSSYGSDHQHIPAEGLARVLAQATEELSLSDFLLKLLTEFKIVCVEGIFARLKARREGENDQIAEEAFRGTLKKAYRKLLLQIHPDKATQLQKTALLDSKTDRADTVDFNTILGAKTQEVNELYIKALELPKLLKDNTPEADIQAALDGQALEHQLDLQRQMEELIQFYRNLQGRYDKIDAQYDQIEADYERMRATSAQMSQNLEINDARLKKAEADLDYIEKQLMRDSFNKGGSGTKAHAFF